ncbi:MAG: hypothetical protein IJO85_09295, partial [Lachnospiraceae bacterium]|nr:hypothetical protein [Lachnospiraceae bacterium]
MPQMLWSGLCYFLNGARRHEVLLGELFEQRAEGAWRVFGEQDKSNMPNAPFRKYQTSGFAFEAYSSALYSLEEECSQPNLYSPKPEFISNSYIVSVSC